MWERIVRRYNAALNWRDDLIDRSKERLRRDSYREGEGRRERFVHVIKSRWFKRIAAVCGVLLLIGYGVSTVRHYHFAEPFTLAEAGYVAANPTHKGTAIVRVLIKIIGDLENDWQPNDLALSPTQLILDNPRNFQYGELFAIREVIIILREELGRLRTNDEKNPHVVAAYNYVANDTDAWIYPRFEWKLADARRELGVYLKELESGKAKIYPRADNMNALLYRIASMLGDEARRLENAYGPREITSEETAGDRGADTETILNIQTPWREIDDNFFRAQGVLYVMSHIYGAAREDFREIIRVKKADAFADRVREVFNPEGFLHDPLYVSNGGRLSMWPNHSMQLVGIVQTTRQYVSSLISALEQ